MIIASLGCGGITPIGVTRRSDLDRRGWSTIRPEPVQCSAHRGVAIHRPSDARHRTTGAPPIVMCDTIPAGDEVAHYGLVSPAHYGFWKALTGRVAPVNRRWETPDIPPGVSLFFRLARALVVFVGVDVSSLRFVVLAGGPLMFGTSCLLFSLGPLSCCLNIFATATQNTICVDLSRASLRKLRVLLRSGQREETSC